ncbi:MAG TPA: hypothetical protein VE870_03155 [Bacteroidales bacterium]|nr:hypothetical protein [Bacteroidales bacterium]
MNAKLLKILIYISGVVCLYAFIAIRIHPLFNAILKEKIMPGYWENTKYGELYYFNFIHEFREKGLPEYRTKYRFTKKSPTLDKADLVLFGDSFFDFSRMETIPEKLKDTLGLNVFYARYDRPMKYLEENGYQNNHEKLMIYESAERYIPTRFTKPQPDYSPDPRSKFRQDMAKVRDFIFVPDKELLYNTLLYRSYPTTGIYSFLSTLKFNVFGYITKFTPEYYLGGKTPWLFYYDQMNDEPGSFYYNYSKDEINTYCDNIKDLSDRLYKKYKLKMIFMAIPSKYSIYHTLLNNDKYNDFIPRLYAGLRERDIPVVPVYRDFISADTVLYYGTDTHWNKKGRNIALDNTIEVLDSINYKKNIYESNSLSWRVRNKDK